MKRNRQDPNAPLCAYPGCTKIRASKGKRGENSPVLAEGGDTRKRFTWCNYHRKGKGKKERQALHENSNDSI